MGERRAQGRGSRRDVSPNNSKDRRSDWRHDASSNPARARLPRRSATPPARERPHRSLTHCRGKSTDRKDHNPRRPDHGKQQLDERVASHHSQDRPTRALGNDGYGLRHTYMLEDRPTSANLGMNPGLKSSRVTIGDDDFHRSGNRTPQHSCSGLSGHDILGRKPRYLDDTSLPTTLFPHSPGRGYPSDGSALYSTGIGTSSTHLKFGLYANDALHDRDSLRRTYDEVGEDKPYSRDVSYPMIPDSQKLRHYSVLSSSGIANEDLGGPSRGRLHLCPDGFTTRGISNIMDGPLDCNSYPRMQQSEPLGHQLSPPARPVSGGHDYIEHVLKPRDDGGLISLDGLQRKMPWDTQGASGEAFPRFVGLAQQDVDGPEASQRNTGMSNFWEENYSSHRDQYNVKGVHEDYVAAYGSAHIGAEMRLSRGREHVPSEESYGLERNPDLMNYRERPRSPLLPDHRMDAFKQNMIPPRGMLHKDDIDGYDQSPQVLMKLRYSIDSVVDKGILSDGRNSFRHARALIGGDEPWYNEDRAELLPSRSLAFGHAKYRDTSGRMSGYEARLQPPDSSPHAEGGHNMSLKRRLRPGPPEFHSSFPSERRDGFSRPYKFWKGGLEDRHGSKYAHTDDVTDDEMLFTKTDPPEDSEEFKKQVNKAFLRFVKFLYGSTHQQKRYREPEKGSILICCICGSLSKEFADTHSLVTHAYRSLKVGLRTGHLGLHKALCVLMGWNWLIPPDNPRAYQFNRPEAKSLKQDLILWPPIVIIHNSSIGNKNNTDGPRIISNEGVKEIITGLGFEAGKMQVCRGKPANQSILLVKFMPTFSGLQEAERLHKHYAYKSHGRKEFEQLVSSKSSRENVGATNVEVEKILYGYMAIAEDLNKIDPETKKRCLVKSKKDIEAIADAPLDTD